MYKLLSRKILILLLFFVFIEALSCLGFVFPLANKVVFLLIIALSLVLSCYRLEYGLLMVLAELFIGSKGYLFFWQFHGGQFSLRLGLWLAVMLVFIIKFTFQIIQKKQAAIYWHRIRKFIFWKPFIILAVFVSLGVFTALVYHHALVDIFLDFNAWLYFLLILPLLAVYHRDGLEKNDNLKAAAMAAVIWLSLKTLILLFIFTHNLSFEGEVYTWLRKTLVGEMTPTNSGWPRIFIQSQIFPIIAYFFLFWYQQIKLKALSLLNKKHWLSIILAGLFFSSLLISFSRSFWLAAFITTLLTLIFVWRLQSFRLMMKAVLWMFISGVIGVGLTYLVAVLPISQPDGFRANIIDRVSNRGEAAVVSRWSLLYPLMDSIKESPIIGQGFGSTITYVSSDPRVLANNIDGQYTTYAFEWGYLDMWLKIGILGLLAYVFLLYGLFRASLGPGLRRNSYILLSFAAGLVFLTITHFFTPYLNHPLGIGFLLLASCLISQDRVY